MRSALRIRHQQTSFLEVPTTGHRSSLISQPDISGLRVRSGHVGAKTFAAGEVRAHTCGISGRSRSINHSQ
jgi:hypothetical protein